MVRLGLDWMNLFAGMTGHQIVSVFVALAFFLIASGLCLLALVLFGVRAGLMAPQSLSGAPPASDRELGAFLVASALGFVAVLAMIFTGLLGGGAFAELYLDNPLVFPVTAILIILGGVCFLFGVGQTFRSARAHSRRGQAA